MNEPRVMRELHELREKHYEETKHMDSEELARSINEAARKIAIERAKNNYSAYIPDVPGCVATGKTPDEAREEIMKALKMHLAGLKEDGLPIPEPQAQADYVAAKKFHTHGR